MLQAVVRFNCYWNINQDNGQFQLTLANNQQPILNISSATEFAIILAMLNEKGVMFNTANGSLVLNNNPAGGG